MLTVFVTYHYFLGLRTLTVIQNAVRLVNENRPEGQKIDMHNIDYDDKNVYEMIGAGKCEGIFQLESAGMKSFMKELKPHNLEDVIAGISLYRPGPMDFIPKYIKGKNEKESIKYECPQLEPILKPTHGCIVYQEQVMQIVRDLAGYSFGRSDLVRRAMAKKKADVMEKERKNFVYGNEEEGVKGCVNNGIPEAVANHIYDEMTDFAKYAFNKSHAAAYAVVSYQTAYLKYYYPVEFMAALLTSVIDNSTKVSEYIMTCRQMGIDILPPDINEGQKAFSVSGNSIRYGLSAIKGLGGSVIDSIVKEREAGGVFTSLKDFAKRLSGKEVNKRTVESFIKAGAFDSMPGTRKQKMMVYVQVLDGVAADKKRNLEGQMSFFDFATEEQKETLEVTMPDVGEYSKEDVLAFEKEVLGIYVSGHPLEEYEAMWKKNITNTTLDFAIDEETDSVKVNDGVDAIIGGMITAKTIKTTRTNSLMAFITVEDLYGTVEVIVFPRDYEKNRANIEEEKKVFIKGRIAVEEDKPAKIVCQKIIPFEDLPKQLWIKFKNRAEYEKNKTIIEESIATIEGRDYIIIYCEEEKQQKKIPHIMATIPIIDKFIGQFGPKNVKVVDSTIDKL